MVTLTSPLTRCGADILYKLDGSSPANGSDGNGSTRVYRGPIEILPPAGRPAVNLTAAVAFQCSADLDGAPPGAAVGGPPSRFEYTFPADGEEAACGPAWRTYSGSAWCFQHFPAPPGLNFTEAEAACQAAGGHLASVGSEEENRFLIPGLIPAAAGPDTAAWIGLTSRPPPPGPGDPVDGGGGGRWVDGGRWTDGAAVRYTNWVGGGRLRRGGGWCALLGRGD